MDKAYLTLERVKSLQDSIGFLNDYRKHELHTHHIGPNINTEDVRATRLLRELGEINSRREEIIKQLMSL